MLPYRAALDHNNVTTALANTTNLKIMQHKPFLNRVALCNQF